MEGGGFNAVKNVWARREARSLAAKKSSNRLLVANGDLLRLPSELLVVVCSSPEIQARDLVALDLTCSAFHKATGSGLSVTEEAAKIKINEATINALPNYRLNYKALLYHLREASLIPIFSCPRCQWRVGGFRCQGRRPSELVRGWEVDDGDGRDNADEENAEENASKQKEDEIPPVPEPSGCGCYLIWDQTKKELFCPAGCGSIRAPLCACEAYRQKTDEERADTKAKWFDEMTPFDLKGRGKVVFPPSGTTKMGTAATVLTKALLDSTAKLEETDDRYRSQSVSKKTPSLTCVCCGYTVDGFACLGRKEDKERVPCEDEEEEELSRPHVHGDPPRPFRQEGFYERVWCSYRWGCVRGCRVWRAGPEGREEERDRASQSQDSALLCCVSRPQCDRKGMPFGKRGTEMAALEWVDSLGPASNYYSYKPCKKKTTAHEVD